MVVCKTKMMAKFILCDGQLYLKYVLLQNKIILFIVYFS